MIMQANAKSIGVLDNCYNHKAGLTGWPSYTDDMIRYIFVNAPYFNALRVESEERMVFLGGHPAKY
jgi:hypothetical protein